MSLPGALVREKLSRTWCCSWFLEPWRLGTGQKQAELCLSSTRRSSHMKAGGPGKFCATGMGEKLSGLLGSVLVQVGLQASIDPVDFSVSLHA